MYRSHDGGTVSKDDDLEEVDEEEDAEDDGSVLTELRHSME